MDVLVVTVVKAAGLKGVDKDGLSDPYTVVSFEGKKQTTSIKRDTLAPSWGDTFEYKFNAAEKPLGTMIQFKVYDWNRVKKKVLLGTAAIEVPSEHGRKQTHTLQLAEGTGTLTVELELDHTSRGQVVAGSGSNNSGDGSSSSCPSDGSSGGGSGARRSKGKGHARGSMDADEPYVPVDASAEEGVLELRLVSATGLGNAGNRVYIMYDVVGKRGNLTSAASSAGASGSKAGGASKSDAKRSSRHRVKDDGTATFGEQCSFRDVNGGGTLGLTLFEAHRKGDVELGTLRVPVGDVPRLDWSDYNGEFRATGNGSVVGALTYGLKFVATAETRSSGRPVGVSGSRVAAGGDDPDGVMEGAMMGGGTRRPIPINSSSRRASPVMKVEVTVVRAERLLKFDRFGKSDPYIWLHATGNAKVKTSTQKKTLNPVWGETFVFDVNAEHHPVLELVMFDWDRGSKDEFMGRIIIDLNTLRLGPEPIDIEADMNNDRDQGTVFLTMRLLETDASEGVTDLGVALAGTTRGVAVGATEDSLSGHGKDVVKHELVVHVIKARNLPKRDRSGKADPYVKLTVGQQMFKTRVVKKSLNPAWTAEIHAFEGFGPSWQEDLKVAVFDWDRFGGHEKMGTTTIPLSNFNQDTFVDDWFDLVDVESGEIHMTLTYKRSRVRVDGNHRSYSQAPSGKLTVNVHQGFQLLNEAGHAPTAYVAVNVGSQQRKTKTAGENSNPEWQEQFSFDQIDSTAELTLAVFDGQRSEPLGSTTIPLGAMVHAKLDKRWVPIKLAGVDRGEIKISTLFWDSRGESVGAGAVVDLSKVTLDVLLVEAAGLKSGMSGYTNPFVVFKYGDDKWESPTLKKQVNPVWNNTFRFESKTDKRIDRLGLTVYNSSHHGGDAALGDGTIDLTLLEMGVQQDLWVRLDHAASGKVHVRLTVNYAKDEHHRAQRIPETDGSDFSDDEDGGGGLLYPGIAFNARTQLTLRVIAARELKPSNVKGCNPYVVAHCGDKSHSYGVALATTDPQWDEEFVFDYVKDSDTLAVNLFSWERYTMDPSLGFVEVPISRLPANKRVEMTLPLSGAPHGEIDVEVMYAFVASGDDGDLWSTDDEWSEDGGDRGHAAALEDTLLLFSNVVEARDLETKLLGNCDTYVVIEIQKNLKARGEDAEEGDAPTAVMATTSVRRSQLAPIWNEKFEVPFLHGAGEVAMYKVYQWNLLRPDRLVGVARLDLDKLPLLREEDQWLALEVPDPENEARLVRGQGSLHIQVTAKHTHMFRDADMKQSILAVLVEADIDAECDPYAVLTVGSSEQVSSTRLDTDSPNWNEAFRFRCSRSDILHVTVYDWEPYADDVKMGSGSLPLTYLDEKDGGSIWVALHGASGGKVRLEITLLDDADGDGVPDDEEEAAAAAKDDDEPAAAPLGLLAVAGVVMLFLLYKHVLHGWWPLLPGHLLAYTDVPAIFWVYLATAQAYAAAPVWWMLDLLSGLLTEAGAAGSDAPVAEL